jgi:hypothetical protein
VPVAAMERTRTGAEVSEKQKHEMEQATGAIIQLAGIGALFFRELVGNGVPTPEAATMTSAMIRQYLSGTKAEP